MKHGPANHHPRCTCHKCQPPVSRTPAPPPRDPTLFGERRPSTPAARPPAPVAPAVATPPPPIQYPPPPDCSSAVYATVAAIQRMNEAAVRAGSDPRAARLLALRRQGIARDEAMRIVDTEFTERTPRK